MLEITYDLLLVVGATAVGGGKGGAALLKVPWLRPLLGSAADGEGVDTVGIPITVTGVLRTATVTGCPHKD